MTDRVRRCIDWAIALAALLMPVVMGVVSYGAMTLSDHARRITWIERGDIEAERRFEQIEEHLLRIESKIDRLTR